MSMGGSSKTPDTQTQVSKPFPEQLPHVNRVFAEANALFNQGPQQFYPGGTVAGFAPETLHGFQTQKQAADRIAGQANLQSLVSQHLLRSPSPEFDPTVNAFADAATRPMIDQFNQAILPSIGSRAVREGAFGGSRQAIQEAQAAEGLARQVGDVRAGIFNDAFGRQLDAQQRALALAPQTNQQLAIAPQLYSQIGASRENLAQQVINEQVDRFNFEQQAQLQNLQNFSNLVNQFGGGQTTYSGLPQAQRSPLQGAIGGASLGASLAPTLGFAGPVGALAGGLFGLFS